MTRNLSDILALLPDFFAQHLLLSLTALAIGLAISLPLAVVTTRVAVLRGPVLTVAGAIQTVPSLALLALMVPLLGMIGFVPALIALVLYSMLPVLRNTVTGILGVDPALIEAARGVGMTPMQTLWKVELPVAAPTIIAGIRTATVWVIGIATLATPVGQTTLGNFIFVGLQTQNQTAVIVGCVAAAALALLLDGTIRLIETGSARRSRTLQVSGVAALALLTVVGLTPLMIDAARSDARPVAVIGAKTFTEQYVLAEVIAKRLDDAGFRTSTRSGMGSQLLFDALSSGAADCYVDYSGTIWANVMQRTDHPPRRQMMTEMKRWLSRERGVALVGRLGFENTYCLAMRRSQADELGIRSISDLARHAPRLVIGGDMEFFGRPEWAELRDAYKLAFRRNVGLDASIMYSACAGGQVDVISAFSSDGRIAAFDLIVLTDDRGVFPPYDAVVLMSAQAAAREDLRRAILPLIDSIDDDTMRQANKLVDVDGQSPAAAARFILSGIAVGEPGDRPTPPAAGHDEAIEASAVPAGL